MKIGILGSSHSYGGNGNKKSEMTPRLVDELQMLVPHVKWIDYSQPGKGSELYANFIIDAYHTHKVDALLIESIANRSSRYIFTGKYFNKTLDTYIKHYPTAYSELHSSCTFTSNPNRPDLAKNLSFNKYKRWTDLKLMMLDDNAATEISKIDLYYAYQLCDILNIKTIKWSMFDNYTTDDKEQRCVYDFLEENLKANPKENKHLWSDDDVHLNKVWQKRMLRKYLIPIINYKLENKND